jgi:hypothetical protein
MDKEKLCLYRLSDLSEELVFKLTERVAHPEMEGHVVKVSVNPYTFLGNVDRPPDFRCFCLICHGHSIASNVAIGVLDALILSNKCDARTTV